MEATAVEKLASFTHQAGADVSGTWRFRNDRDPELVNVLERWKGDFFDGIGLEMSQPTCELFASVPENIYGPAAAVVRSATPVGSIVSEVGLDWERMNNRAAAGSSHSDAGVSGMTPTRCAFKLLIAAGVGHAPGADDPQSSKASRAAFGAALNAAANSESSYSYGLGATRIARVTVPRGFALIAVDRGQGMHALLIEIAPDVYLALKIEHEPLAPSEGVLRLCLQSKEHADRVPLELFMARLREHCGKPF